MPVTIGQLTSNTAKATFTVSITQEDPETGEEHTFQEQVNITYYPGRITEKTMALAKAYNEQSDLDTVLNGVMAFNEEIVRLIKWWDVLENEEGDMFPLDAKRLSELPFYFRGQLLAAMAEGVSPEAQAPHQNGHR